ncbi:MAG: deoxyribodipyrimidine photolyase [Zetaproteobacteria bacterium CG12_big_fil_rev_8_21_14_0_65_54_13]|nr:MAG: deoxyribodipyrimidine photolyase [Zetaproteobacteria bacterium CG23_combo_of_CG06-09_8_20_14_all_54_7]PIW47104.1 MAG: deoxyribodipyrimidine photolyase [Zetaproteobacteria bacterium CG12_big_fil_rev_8_21_14_0_65_54_13]PIX54105.1 MAG: deoxyribodipyrimidine photolyase [Zetaproteobacteria bacterium CG_4_10_14_3_um_filter_54_28]PJA27178.1 MAG: deoxyribodipyrimidine photolyase [Zetaproteobacteria bacterium CG_4_9_14_3_um_filter_54_145]
MHAHALVVLRRDLRMEDNLALFAACNQSRRVSICFILDPVQLQPHAWRSGPALAFMIDSLGALHGRLKGIGSGLIVRQGDPLVVLAELMPLLAVDALYANRDYTPFARSRDRKISALCLSAAVASYWFDDALLNPPGSLLNGSGRPYQVFTPFFRAASRLPVAQPVTPDYARLAAMDEACWQQSLTCLQAVDCRPSAIDSGRDAGVALLQQLSRQHAYSAQRDLPALDSTSHLSVHLKFGTLSVREVYSQIFHLLGCDHPLIRQLYWRDFFTHTAFHFPHVFGHSYHARFEQLRYSVDAHAFRAWCEGSTGFPIVDAGMRELAESGFMHNRVRMITASFLVKDLHIDWRKGEAWFARHLIDYDPAVNNGNWQWAASTGCDAQPWFRIFNPWLQQKRFDPECLYIKRWLPALAAVSAGEIHRWQKAGDTSLHPLPMLDHKREAAVAKVMYQHCIKTEYEYARDM